MLILYVETLINIMQAMKWNFFDKKGNIIGTRRKKYIIREQKIPLKEQKKRKKEKHHNDNSSQSFCNVAKEKKPSASFHKQRK